MDLLSDLAGRRGVRDEPKGAIEATIQSTPSSATERVYVSFDAPSQRGRRRGPCPWEPHGTDWPKKGDAAVVIQTDLGALWIIAWWSEPS